MPKIEDWETRLDKILNEGSIPFEYECWIRSFRQALERQRFMRDDPNYKIPNLEIVMDDLNVNLDLCTVVMGLAKEKTKDEEQATALISLALNFSTLILQQFHSINSKLGNPCDCPICKVEKASTL